MTKLSPSGPAGNRALGSETQKLEHDHFLICKTLLSTYQMPDIVLGTGDLDHFFFLGQHRFVKLDL